MRFAIPAILIFFVCYGCKKAAGPGGNSSIKGKVIIRKFNFNPSVPQYLYSYPDMADNVYITYGSQPGVGNSVNTDMNGEYYFPYLYPGTYSVYVYSKDTTLTNVSGELVAKQDINLGSGSNATLPDIVIAK